MGQPMGARGPTQTQTRQNLTRESGYGFFTGAGLGQDGFQRVNNPCQVIVTRAA